MQRYSSYTCITARPLAGSLLVVALAACSPGGESGTSGTPEAGNPLDAFECPGGVILPGANSAFPVDGAVRNVIVDFPDDTSRPMAVVFSWHGFMTTAEAHHDAFAFNPDHDPSIPTIIVTPDDAGFLPPEGLDWQIGVPPSGPSADIALFEAVLGCLNAQQAIDPARIYSHGFSAGSVMTSLLYSVHPHVLAAVINESGAWMNDPTQAALVNWPTPLAWNWPALDPEDEGNVLLTHGGPGDVTVLDVLNLENAAQAALPFLEANRRTVVDCPHGSGHVPAPTVTGGERLDYLFAHQKGQPSPFADGSTASAPKACDLRLP